VVFWISAHLVEDLDEGKLLMEKGEIERAVLGDMELEARQQEEELVLACQEVKVVGKE